MILENNINTVIKGNQEKAVYKEQFLDEYKNNPFIEALPQIYSEDDVIDNLYSIPILKVRNPSIKNEIKYHMLKRIKTFIQPLPIHIKIERRLSTLIRRGYISRNPLEKEYLEKIKLIHKIRENESLTYKNLNEELRW